MPEETEPHSQGGGPAAGSLQGENGQAHCVLAQLVIHGRTDRVGLGRDCRGRPCLRVAAHGTVADRPGWTFTLGEAVCLGLPRPAVSNRGLVAVDTPDGRFAIRFQGRVRGPRIVAEGTCTVEGASGRFEGLQATGCYRGVGGLRFQVTWSIAWPPGVAEACRLR